MNSSFAARSVATLAFCISLCFTHVNAQQNQSLQPTAAEIVTISPKLALSDVKAVYNFLDGVEISGTEVDAFIEVKKSLNKAIEAGKSGNKKDDDTVVVEMRMDVANNFYVLMQRSKLKGSEADKFRQIISSVQEAAKAAQKK